MNPNDDIPALLSDFFQLDTDAWPARALLQIDPASDTVVVVQPQPCDCTPLDGATRFPARAEDCDDAPAADRAIFRYDYLARDPDAVDALPPADLNNIACYLLWQTGATPEHAKAAHDLLKKARARADDALRPVIDANLDRFRPIEPGVPRSLAALQAEIYRAGRTMSQLDDWMIDRS